MVGAIDRSWVGPQGVRKRLARRTLNNYGWSPLSTERGGYYPTRSSDAQRVLGNVPTTDPLPPAFLSFMPAAASHSLKTRFKTPYPAKPSGGAQRRRSARSRIVRGLKANDAAVRSTAPQGAGIAGTRSERNGWSAGEQRFVRTNSP